MKIFYSLQLQQLRIVYVKDITGEILAHYSQWHNSYWVQWSQNFTPKILSYNTSTLFTLSICWHFKYNPFHCISFSQFHLCESLHSNWEDAKIFRHRKQCKITKTGRGTEGQVQDIQWLSSNLLKLMRYAHAMVLVENISSLPHSKCNGAALVQQ